MKKNIFLIYSFIFSFFFSTVQAQIVKLESNGESNIIQSADADSDARFGYRMADNVLLLHAEHNVHVVDIQSLLQAAGGFASIDLFDAGNANQLFNTPVLADLMPYDVVLVWSNVPWNNPVGVGDALAEYIEAGGAVVDMTFAHMDNIFAPGTDIAGDFHANYDLFSGSDGTFEWDTNNSLVTIHEPSHPIMAGVTTINNIDFTFNGMVSSSATIIAEKDNADPLVIIEENVGPRNVRRAALLMWPASTNTNPLGLEPTDDGYTLIANTINWVAEESLSTSDNSLDNGITLFSNPVRNQVTISNNTFIELEKASIYDTNGRLVQTLDLSDIQGQKTFDLSNLAGGIYMVQIQGEGANTVKRLVKE